MRGPVTSSADRVRGSYQGTETIRRTKLPWQAAAWSYYDLIGEVHDAAQFVAKGLSPLRWFVEKQQPDGTWAEIDREGASGSDRTALEVWDEVQDPGGGRAKLISNYGRQRVVSGESYLLCTGHDDPTKPTMWEMVSTDELRPKGDGWERVKAPGVKETYVDPPDDAWEPLPGEALVFRMWRPHPRYSALADSPMRAMLGDCESIALLAQSMRNKTRNRLKGSGLLLIPDEAAPPEPGDEEDPDGSNAPVDDTDPAEDPMMQAITEAIVAPIGDETDPSAVVPLMIRVPMDTIDSFRLMDFASSADVTEADQIEKLVVRLARGFDMPPELLLGLAVANHWNAWMIDRQTWKAHLQGYADEAATDFTTAFLWAQLMANNVSGVEIYRIGYDESEVVNNPDRSKDSRELFDRYAISYESLREAHGFDDSDEPSDEEIQERITLAQAIGGSPDGSESGSTGAADSAPAATPDGATASLDGAISVAMIRCRELAGSRVRTRAQRDPLILQTIDGVHNRDVVSALGREDPWLIGLGQTPEQLVRGGTESLAVWMEQEGYSSRRIASTCMTVERMAAAELFSPTRTADPAPA